MTFAKPQVLGPAMRSSEALLWMLRLSWTRTMVLACAKWMSAKSFKARAVIHGGMAICDLDVTPAFERSKHHEEIGGAIALILIIETCRASCFHRDRHARFGNELLRGLVEANQRTIAVAWPRVDG